MKLLIDQEVLCLVSILLGLLFIASIVGWLLSRRSNSEAARKVIDNLNARIKSWWIMVTVFVLSVAIGKIGSILLFAFMSFLALREFITLTPTKRADHRSLFWAFFVFIPLQYYLIAIEWYGLFSILIPVYAFLLIPIRSVVRGDVENFLERTAKIQWGLMVCVYFVSHVPALLMLDIPGYTGENAKLLFYLVVVVQLSDVFQYIFGKCFGKTPISPNVSPHKTMEGLVGGIAMAVLVGTLLWWITPFTPGQSALISLLISLMGFLGGLTMSAIKRDRGVKDYGSLIGGHGGILDRIDSLCFTAPVYFHVIRYFFV